MRKFFLGILVLTYLMVIAYFAVRPLQPIIGLCYGDATFNFEEGAVHLRAGGALEERGKVSRMRKALMDTGQMSLVVSLRPDSLNPRVPGLIIGYSHDSLDPSFELVQEGAGVSISLLTSNPGRYGMPAKLTVPAILNTHHWQQLIATYDGSRLRLFVDGLLCSEHSDLSGDFSNWGRDHALIIGDEPAGGQPWSGLISRVMIYDRALDDNEIVILNEGRPIPGAVIDHDFRAMQEPASLRRNGLKRLHYRNLFIIADAMNFQLDDFVMNIVGFLPLGFFVYLMLSPRFEQRKILSVILLPIAVGLLASGGIEWAQRYILGRVPSVLDLINNIIGTLLGSLLAWLMNSTYRKWSRSPRSKRCM